MERFLALEYDSASKVPPIGQLLGSIGENEQNKSFFQIANQLHFSDRLNATYSLVSLRKIVEIFPALSTEPCDDALNPTSSFRWLYLIHSLASRSLTDDQELDEAKVLYVLNAYVEFVKRTDLKSPYIMPFLTGVFCAIARLLDAHKKVPDFLVTDEVYAVLLKILRSNEVANPTIELENFAVKDIFLFGCPVSLEVLTQGNLFSDTKTLVKAALLRVLSRILPQRVPSAIDDYRATIQPLCVKGMIVEPAEKVLVQLFDGDTEKAYQYNDTIQYRECSAVIVEKAKKTGAFRSALLYQECIVLSENLVEMIRVATERPEHWKSFLANSECGKDLAALMFSDYDMDFVVAAAKLLRMGEAKLDDTGRPLRLMITSRSENLRNELMELLLQQPESVANDVLNVFSLACSFGSRSRLFFDFLLKLVDKVSNEQAAAIITGVVNSLKKEYSNIKQLPNSHVYVQLSQYIDVPASYLDEQPCTVCNNPERELSMMVVSDSKAMIKFTYDSCCIKLTQPVTVQSFTVAIKNRKSMYKSPRVVKVYLSSVDITDASDLITDAPKWRLVAEIDFPKDSLKECATLPLQTYATCVKFQVAELWEEARSHLIKCPNCRAEIQDPRSGICPRCHDNCYQCSNCRYINMAHLDGVFCVECGNCTLGQFTTSLDAVPAFSHTQIKTNDDCDKALKKCDDILAEAHESYRELTKLREQIDAALSPACTLKLGDKTELLNTLYNAKCKTIFQNLTTNVQHVYAIRAAIANFKKRMPKNCGPEEHENMCYNCRSTYLVNCLKFFVPIVRRPEVEALDIPSLLFSFAKEKTKLATAAFESLVAFCSLSWELTLKIVDTFRQSLPKVPPQIVQVLCQLEKVDDDQREKRLRVFVKAIKSACPFEAHSSAFTPSVLQPLVMAVCNSPLVISEPAPFIWSILARNAKKKCSHSCDPWELILHRKFARELMLKSSSQTIRSVLAGLYVSASYQGHFSQVADLVIGHVMASQRFSPTDEECYSLLKQVLERRPSIVLHTLFSGLFAHLIELFAKEVDAVLGSEQNIVLNLSIGLEVSEIIKVLQIYLLNVPILRYVIRKRPDDIKLLLTSYFKLRSLIIQRSKYLDDALSILRSIITLVADNEFHFSQSNTADGSTPDDDELTVPNPEGPKLMLTAAIDAISFCPDVVIKEASAIIFPAPKEMDIPIEISKARSQLDYMPGRLPDEPVMSSRIGKIFRDIKSRFCTETGMVALMDDEHTLELLVNGNIIGLNMRIDEIYKRVWIPARGNTPMKVICRLQGVDGEATEPMINESEAVEGENIDPEKQYGYTTVLCGKGFQEMLSAFSSRDVSMKGIEQLVKLLSAMALVKQNRASLIELKAINVLFDAMHMLIEKASPELFGNVISLVKLLIEDAHGQIDDVESKVKFIFDSLKTKLLQDNPAVAAAFMALVPTMALSQDKLLKRIIKFFISELRLESSTEDGGNFFENILSIFMLDMFSEMILALPMGHALRSKIDEEGITVDAVNFIKAHFPLSEGKESETWTHTLQASCLPMILKFLAGMASGHKPAQQLFLADDAVFLKIMIELATVHSTASIGDFADKILENACKEPSICAETINEIKSAKSDTEKRRAQAEREKALAENNVGLSGNLQALMDALDDETEWACCICKEGYSFMGKEVLGVYAYAKKMNGFANTATLFVGIHPSCHASCGDDWEASRIRNEERACNCIFPLPSSTLNPGTYKTALTRFLEPFKGQFDYPTMLAYDLKRHLLTTSCGEKIPVSDGGGSLTAIVQLWPFLIHGMLVYLNDSDLRKKFERVVEENLDAAEDLNGLQDAAVFSLAVATLEQWQAAKPRILREMIRKRGPFEDITNFERFKDLILFIALVDRIQGLIKVPSGVEATVKENGSVSFANTNTEWCRAFCERACTDGVGLTLDFGDFAADIESLILPVSTLKDALAFAGIEAPDADKWISDSLQ